MSWTDFQDVWVISRFHLCVRGLNPQQITLKRKTLHFYYYSSSCNQIFNGHVVKVYCTTVLGEMCKRLWKIISPHLVQGFMFFHRHFIETQPSKSSSPKLHFQWEVFIDCPHLFDICPVWSCYLLRSSPYSPIAVLHIVHIEKYWCGMHDFDWLKGRIIPESLSKYYQNAIYLHILLPNCFN